MTRIFSLVPAQVQAKEHSRNSLILVAYWLPFAPFALKNAFALENDR
jgi:hypothetical protein